jgi:hypothetical protein
VTKSMQWARKTGGMIVESLKKEDPKSRLYLPAGIFAAVLLTADEEICEVIARTAAEMRRLVHG